MGEGHIYKWDNAEVLAHQLKKEQGRLARRKERLWLAKAKGVATEGIEIMIGWSEARITSLEDKLAVATFLEANGLQKPYYTEAELDAMKE